MSDPFNGLLDFNKPEPEPQDTSGRWAHQQQTFEHALDNPRVLDFSDPGTGKTRSHIDVFRHRLEHGESEKCLVLAPKTLLDTAWGEDIDKFQPDLRFASAYAHNREDAFDRDVQFFITNLDAVKWLAQQPKRWFSRRFGSNPTLLIDESTAFKNMNSARSKAVAALRHYFTFRTAMTATPDPNSVLELWHQALLVDDGKRLGTSFYKYRSAVADPVQVGPRPEHKEWQDKDNIEEAVNMLLADITIRHAFDECMDIPPNLTKRVHFDLPRSLQQRYDEMELQSLLSLKKGEVVGINAAAQANKLLQIASGAVYRSDDRSAYEVLDDTRYKLVADLIEQSRHSVTFYNWEHQKDEISKELDKRGVSYEVLDRSMSDKRRAGAVAAYQRGDYQTILLHPATGAHGLTLTRGETTIWSSPVYQADFLKQGTFRIYRGGQTKKTYTKQICANNTVEENVFAKVGKKSAKMDDFLKLLKQRRGDE